MSGKKNKQRTSSKKVKEQTSDKSRTIAIVLGILFILVIVYFLIPQGSQEWKVDKDGVLSYPENRGKVDVTVLNTTKENNDSLETITFQSKDYTVEGLLRIPTLNKKVPAVVLLPGATVTKEGTQTLAVILSKMGYASLGIEQRNRGGVDMEYDYSLFKDGKEPVEHKMVFDALRSVDVLRQDPRIDSQKIAIIGESNGGRFAIIAAALDPEIKGVIGISTSGYDTESQLINVKDETVIRFYRSIDPDTYLGFIPPRRFVMMHSVNDTIIQINLAENTFKKAKEPKQFYTVTTGTHGYSVGMLNPLENETRNIFQ